MTRLEFDARLYTAAALRRSLEAFAESAEGSVEEQGGRLIVDLRSKDGALDADELEGEFANYALAEMQS